MEQIIPIEEVANQRLSVLVNAFTLFSKNLLEEGLDLEKVKAASDRTWGALGMEAGKQIKALFADAPIQDAVFTSGSIASAIHGMQVKEEKEESQKRVEVEKCPWHDAAEAFNMPKKWRFCTSGHEAFSTNMLNEISPSATFGMSKNLPSGDAICKETVTV